MRCILKTTPMMSVRVNTHGGRVGCCSKQRQNSDVHAIVERRRRLRGTFRRPVENNAPFPSATRKTRRIRLADKVVL